MQEWLVEHVFDLRAPFRQFLHAVAQLLQRRYEAHLPRAPGFIPFEDAGILEHMREDFADSIFYDGLDVVFRKLRMCLRKPFCPDGMGGSELVLPEFFEGGTL